MDIAGVGQGTRLFWLRGGPIEDRLESDPWIADATVSRSLPSSLRIDIRERYPVAEFRKGRRWFLVASDGTVLTRAEGDHHLPLLLEPSTPHPERWVKTARVLGGMRPWLRSRIRSVVLKDGGEVVVHLFSGTPVYFGESNSVIAKDDALSAVLEWATRNRQPLLGINVQAPYAPTAQLYAPVAAQPISVDPGLRAAATSAQQASSPAVLPADRHKGTRRPDGKTGDRKRTRSTETNATGKHRGGTARKTSNTAG
jgi:hypothetical protein